MPTKLDYLQQKKLNPSDELRERLFNLETRLPGLKSMEAEPALTLLNEMDTSYALFNDLQARGINLQPEQARFASIEARLKNQARPLLKAIGGPAALASHRPAPPPPADRQGWWYIDQIVADQQKRWTRRGLIAATVLVGLVVGVVVLYQTLLAPSPEAVARYEAESSALAAIEQDAPQTGLSALEEGLAVVPNDPGLLVIKGVLLELLGRADEAADVFNQAAVLFNDNVTFHIVRAQTYMRAGDFEKAAADAQQAIALDEGSPTAWLMLGQALEAQENMIDAITAYQTAADLAYEEGNDEVVVMSRLAIGRITGAPGTLQ